MVREENLLVSTKRIIAARSFPTRIALKKQSLSRPRVAYLVNQYPKVSHTFIRREILALERQGTAVARYALRGWDAEVADSDQAIILDQVENGVAIRMAVLYLLAGARG